LGDTLETYESGSFTQGYFGGVTLTKTVRARGHGHRFDQSLP
jgi:hypothetical protein